MNKKMFLLPFLSISLLVGCAGIGPRRSSQSGTSQSGTQSGTQSQSGQGDKELWELDEVEGESTIAQVKAGTVGEYYTVRGTVVANSGSTLAIYRKGQFLYCYNFKAGAHDGLVDHPLGSYVEIHAQSSAYSESIQLTAFDVGTEKTTDKYDKAAKLTVLAQQGETVAPVKLSAAADFANSAAGTLMEIEFVAGADMTFKVDTANNQDLKGTVNGNKIGLRMEKYLPEAIQTALVADNPAFAVGATYKVVALAAATSDMVVRGVLCEGSSWVKTKDAEFAEPEEVLLDCLQPRVMEGKTTKIDWEIFPENAKQEIEFTSGDEAIAKVDNDGVVTGIAPGNVTITAKAVQKPSVAATFEIEVYENPNQLVVIDFTTGEYTGTEVDVSGMQYSSDYNNYTLAKSSAEPAGAKGFLFTAPKELVSLTIHYSGKHDNVDAYAGTDTTGTKLHTAGGTGALSSNTETFGAAEKAAFYCEIEITGSVTKVYFHNNTDFNVYIYGLTYEIAK